VQVDVILRLIQSYARIYGVLQHGYPEGIE
jgi:hypothetical protein